MKIYKVHFTTIEPIDNTGQFTFDGDLAEAKDYFLEQLQNHYGEDYELLDIYEDSNPIPQDVTVN